MGWRRCRAWCIARSGIYRLRTPPSSAPRRRGPMGALSDAALAAAIKAVLAASPFHGEGHRKVWARLGYAGIRTSLRRVLGGRPRYTDAQIADYIKSKEVPPCANDKQAPQASGFP